MTDYTATLAITVHAPTETNANTWADTLYDLVHAEHGDQMRLDVRVNPPTLPRGGDWQLTRGGEVVHTAATRAEAQAVGVYAIRQETGHGTARIDWFCPACDGDYDPCQDCEAGTNSYLEARGVLTEATYAVEHTAANPTP